MTTQHTPDQITKLQARIAELEAQLYTCTKTADLHKAPAPAQQEPVAWRVRPFDYGIGYEGVDALTTRKEQCEIWARKGWKVEPLYTAPQPDRQPLTDVEVYDLIVAVCSDGSAPSFQEAKEEAPLTFAFARAIEAAHGITESQQ